MKVVLRRNSDMIAPSVDSIPGQSYNIGVERVVLKFASHREQEEADRVYYQNLTPAQRLDILLDILSAEVGDQDEASTRLPRDYRVVKFASG